MLRFDDFRLDPAALQLFRGDDRLDAPPQAVEVLGYLIDNRGR
ncbi:DNA-binding response regulator, partial [Escherichia coli]|nr:DNA-binding response regulator [Escherichia coli]